RLFGDSLGISGLLILVGIIVGGNMFGMVGILLGVPAIAILDFLNRDYFLPWLEKKGPRARAEKAAAREAERAAAKAAKGAKGKAAAEKPAEKPEEKPAEQGD
ncbi:MAG: AI-2E family transporter, partial [Eggerthellaceae bacterium]|nr:AI-2E family transporter [Eggerthellaceae bacterium]